MTGALGALGSAVLAMLASIGRVVIFAVNTVKHLALPPFYPHEFFQAFVNQLGMNLHMDVQHGVNPHHIIEACFKGFARAMDAATALDPRIEGVLSTKGTL